jgi:CHASE3 domain sensor protein
MGIVSDQEIEQGSISFRRAVAIALAVVAALGLIALTVLVTNSNKQRDEALAAQRKSFEIIILTRSLVSQTNRAEAALGRYVVSLKEPPGLLFVDEWRRAGLSIARLRQVTRDNPAQARLAEKLQAIYTVRGALLSEAALHIRYDQKMQGLRAYHDTGLHPTTNQLAATVEQIVANENRLLGQRIKAATRTLEQSNQAAKALLAFAVIILMGAALLGYSAIQALAERRAMRQDADEAARRAEELEEAVAERTIELRRANEALMAEAAEPEDGSGGSADRRHRARFQQHASRGDRRAGACQAAAYGERGRCQSSSGQRYGRRQPRCGADPSPARLRARRAASAGSRRP